MFSFRAGIRPGGKEKHSTAAKDWDKTSPQTHEQFQLHINGLGLIWGEGY
jgi:hypothetical protein